MQLTIWLLYSINVRMHQIYKGFFKGVSELFGPLAGCMLGSVAAERYDVYCGECDFMTEALAGFSEWPDW
jgi:hypothetical protein